MYELERYQPPTQITLFVDVVVFDVWYMDRCMEFPNVPVLVYGDGRACGVGVMHGRDAWAMSLIEYGFWIDKKSPKAEDRSRAVACGGGGGGVMRVRAIRRRRCWGLWRWREVVVVIYTSTSIYIYNERTKERRLYIDSIRRAGGWTLLIH